MCLACDVMALLEHAENLQADLNRANLLLAAALGRTVNHEELRKGKPSVSTFMPSELEGLKGLTLAVEAHPLGGYKLALMLAEEKAKPH